MYNTVKGTGSQFSACSLIKSGQLIANQFEKFVIVMIVVSNTGSYSFELFKFHDFFHDLFKFSKTLGLAVTFELSF